MANVRTPVVMIIFNRPDLTEVLFKEIARARPSKLLVVADGPRPSRPGEEEKVREARKIIERVDWPCEVLRCYSEVNLGCKERVSTGITWAFEQVEEAIILEDDCIPHPSFFVYCDELLEKYRSDERAMIVGGTCFLGKDAPRDESYYFSDLPLIWGWASWRRAWARYDRSMSVWPEFAGSSRFREIFPTATARRHYKKQLDRTFRGDLDTWDIQWCLSIWANSGKCLNSTRNLIRNLGFGPGATHTHFYDPAFDPPVSAALLPLVSPSIKSARTDLDRIWLDTHYSVWAKIRRRIRGYWERARSAAA